MSWDWRDGKWRAVLGTVAPVYVDSDVRAAALAEARLGAGRSMSSFLYVTVGTGVSHSFVMGRYAVAWREGKRRRDRSTSRGGCRERARLGGESWEKPGTGRPCQ